MPIVEYTPDRFDDVKKMASEFHRQMNLAHRPFVDYYYATRASCKLYLYFSDSGKLLGTLGRELLRFVHNSRELTIRVGTNWYSLRRGVGGELSQYSASASPHATGLMFGGSQDTLNILHHYHWIFMPGIRGYFLNNPCNAASAGEPWWRKASKSVLRRATRKKLPSFVARLPARLTAEVIVREEKEYRDDLLPTVSPFTFRFAPTAEYLSWRYNLSLSFVRYRLFRLIVRGKSVGYVILNDSPDQILLAQCDGEDASALAYGVLLSILEVGRNDLAPRTVFLVCSHPEMAKILRGFGFWPQRGGDYPFAFRTQLPGLDLAPDTSNWLINFDWGDNGLRQTVLDRANSGGKDTGEII
jgi:hypothetical protein